MKIPTLEGKAMSHRFHPTVLREYDIRGIHNETLRAEDARQIGRVFAHLAREKAGRQPVIAIARDGRISSPELAAALAEGLKAAGARVIDTGLGPTPMLYFAVYHLNADGGIMVTGSHNPPNHNGFKMMLGQASFFGQAIQALGKRAAEGVADVAGGSVERKDIKEAYITRLLQDCPNIDAANQPERKLKVAWDPGNGAAGECMERIVHRLAGEHFLINATIDGTFPAHHPDPTVPKYLEQLITLVKKGGCDLGIAFDGDGDRLGVVDAKGRILWGDQLLLIMAQDILKKNPGAVVIGDVKASRALFEGIEKLGGTPLMWKTGHSHIKSKMKETGAALAGEMSGHMFIADTYYGFDDALYAALRLVNGLAEPGSPSLEALVDALPHMHNTPEIRIECEESRKFEVIEEIRARLQSADTQFEAVDGVRVERPEGWWLIRASNTGGHLIARAEATNEKDLAKLKGDMEAQLTQSGIALEQKAA